MRPHHPPRMRAYRYVHSLNPSTRSGTDRTDRGISQTAAENALCVAMQHPANDLSLFASLETGRHGGQSHDSLAAPPLPFLQEGI